MNRQRPALDSLLNSACTTADIILLQEINITDPAFATTHPAFTLVLPPRGDRASNRTAAYINRTNPYLKVSQRTDICTDPDLQVLEVGTDLIPAFFLLNIYNERDPETQTYTIPRSLSPLSLPRRCVITGDLNAHHALWNSATRTPKRASELVHLIEQENWRLVSVPDTPTHYYQQGTRSSVIDLTLASPAMMEEVGNWAIDDELATGSDHEVIRFDIQTVHPDIEPTPPPERLNWRKTDWALFSTTLQASISASTTQ
jgi:hypothetical protein